VAAHVSKSIQLDGPLCSPFGRTPTSTLDFRVEPGLTTANRPQFPISTSTKAGPFSVQAYLKFSDGTNIKVVNETFDAQARGVQEIRPVLPPPTSSSARWKHERGSATTPNANPASSYTISVYAAV